MQICREIYGSLIEMEKTLKDMKAFTHGNGKSILVPKERV